MIDWDRVAELRAEFGEDDFGEIVEIFLEEVDAAVGAIGDESEPLESKMHFLKGSALNLGFSSFAELCQRGETSAALGRFELELEEIVASYHASREAFLSNLESQFAA